MPAVVDRRIGIYHPCPRVGNTYPRTMPRLAGQLGRIPDTYSVFLDGTAEWTGKAGAVAPHTDVEQAVTVDGMDLLIAWQPIRAWADRGDGVYVPRWMTGAEILSGMWDSVIVGQFTAWAALRKPDTTAPWLDTRDLWEAQVLGSYFFPNDSPNQLSSRRPCGTSGGHMADYTKVWTNDAGDPIIASNSQYIAVRRYLYTLLTAISSKIRVWYVVGANDARAEMDRGTAGVTAVNLYPGDAYCYGVGYDNYEGLQGVWWGPARLARGIRRNDLDSTLAAEIGVTITRGAGAQTGYSYAYDMFQAIAPTKPVMIGEINCCEPGDPLGPANFGAGQSKADWYTAFWALDASWCPNIVSINWFNSSGTRKYYPFDSSSGALDAFIAGFTQRTGSSTWRVAPAWAPPDGETSAPPDSDDLSVDIVRRQPDAVRKQNVLRWWLRQISWRSPGGQVALRGASDGSTAALQVTSDMGTLPLGQYIPMVNLIGPALTAGSRKILLALRELGDSAPRWQIRSDGRQSWTTGTGSSDLNLFRSTAGVLGVTGASDAAAAVNVDTAQLNKAQLADLSASPASPGTGQAYLFVKGGALRLKTALQELQMGRQPQAEAAYGDWEAWTDRALLSTSTSGPQPPAAGTALCTLVTISSARTLTSLATYIQSAGGGLSGCYLAAYLASDGSLLAYTDDRASTWQSTGYKAVSGANFTSVAAVTNAPTKVWLLAWCVTATTLPRFLGLGSSGAGDGAPVKRFGTLTGMTGTPPASITVGSITASGAAPWIGVL